MPAMRTYIVTQTRQIEVSANDTVGAVRIADLAFKGEPVKSTLVVELQLGIWGHSHGEPLITETHAREKRL